MSNKPRAQVYIDKDGRTVLDDPDALAMIRAIEKHNCKLTLETQRDRVEHFKNRAKQLGTNPDTVVIVLVNVDDVHGKILAEALMPGHEWQLYRDRGEVPFARGLAGRTGVQEFLALFDTDAAEKLQVINGLAVVVVDRGTAEVFEANT